MEDQKEHDQEQVITSTDIIESEEAENSYSGHADGNGGSTEIPTPLPVDSANAAEATANRNERLDRNALAWSPSTHCLAKLLIPILIGFTHYLFWYGQTTNMWKLTAIWQANVSYVATSHETKLALQTLHLDTSGTIDVPHHEKTIRTFTYAYAIKELWHAQHMPGMFLPRLAAGGLVLFSGVWPHVKLFMLLMTWWFSRHPTRRRRCLASLSVLGKWSLVDVLVVCVMVGVLNLEWTFTAVDVLSGVQNHLPAVVALVHALYSAEQICSMALHYSCTDPSKFNHVVECKACRMTVNSWFDHPDSAQSILSGLNVSGGGNSQLFVAGLEGIYAFCGAVVLSILLSIAVDWYDHQSQRRRRREELQRSTERQPEEHWWLTSRRTTSNEEDSSADATPEISGTLSAAVSVRGDEEGGAAMVRSHSRSGDRAESLLHPLLMVENGESRTHHARRRDIRSAADLDFDRRVLVRRQQCGHIIWQFIAWITTIAVIVATSSVTLERHVNGALPLLLHDILGVIWTKQYSFWLLGWTTAMAGGWDLMLMATFVWFVIVGPLLRSLLCIAASCAIPTAEHSIETAEAIHRRHRRLSTWIDFVGAFCAWEVFTVAVCMVDLLMPSITSTILMDKRCAKLAEQTGESICLEVEFDVMKRTYATVLVGGFLLLFVSQRIRNIRNVNQA